MKNIISEKLLTAKGVIGIFQAYSENETVFSQNAAFNFPRQLIDKGAAKPNFSLADFIAPEDDYLGMFAVTTGHGLDRIVRDFEEQNDDYNLSLIHI